MACHRESIMKDVGRLPIVMPLGGMRNLNPEPSCIVHEYFVSHCGHSTSRSGSHPLIRARQTLQKVTQPKVSTSHEPFSPEKSS